MVEYKVKYKLSSIFVAVLILVVVVGFVYVNFYYLVGVESKINKIITGKVTDQEMNALNEIKTATVDNVAYKQLVPIAEVSAVKVDPTVKSNPFKNKDQKDQKE